MTPELERLLGAMAAAGRGDGAALAAYGEFVRSCGLDHFVLGMASGDPVGDPAVEIRSSLPDAWMEEYDALDHVRHDYVVQQMEALGPDRPLLASVWGQTTADQPEVSARTGQVLRGVADAGLGNAVSFMGQGVAGGDQTWFAATFGCRRQDREVMLERVATRRNELLIAAFAMFPYLRPALERQRAGIEEELTGREVDVLARFSEGLRPDRIAHRMGISKRTVDMHSVNARRKLKARTLAEATAKAVRFDLI
jgi:DNA-binding CsgD family transcriptional regulator